MNQNINDIDMLVDIRTIKIDKSLSKDKRIAEYVRQIKDPYRYKCGKFIVTAKYADNGVMLEDCLRNMMN